MATITIKVSLASAPSDVRQMKVLVPPGGHDRSFSAVIAAIQVAFKLCPTEAIALTWVDDDGDTITLSGEEDWSDAVAEHAGSTIQILCTAGGVPDPNLNVRGFQMHRNNLTEGGEKQHRTGTPLAAAEDQPSTSRPEETSPASVPKRVVSPSGAAVNE